MTVQLPATVTVYPSATVIGPALIPFVVLGIVIFSLIVCIFVLIIPFAPNVEGKTPDAIFEAVIASSFICAVSTVSLEGVPISTLCPK